jgi:TPR repeat protein
VERTGRELSSVWSAVIIGSPFTTTLCGFTRRTVRYSSMTTDSSEANGSKRDPRWVEAIASWEEGNTFKALALYKVLAEDGEAYALVEIGNLYELGTIDGSPSFEEAAKWYRKAVFSVDDPKAHLGLARMLFNRQLQGNDNDEAFVRHAFAAAGGGESLALLLLGLAYEGGRLGVLDKKKAAFYYERAALEGLILAERRLIRLALDSHQYLVAAKLFVTSFFKSIRIAIRRPTDSRLAGISPDSFTIKRT